MLCLIVLFYVLVFFCFLLSMSVFVFCVGGIGLTVNGDVNVVLFCYARLFSLSDLFAGTVLLNGTVDDCMSWCLLYCLSACQ